MRDFHIYFLRFPKSSQFSILLFKMETLSIAHTSRVKNGYQNGTAHEETKAGQGTFVS